MSDRGPAGTYLLPAGDERGQVTRAGPSTGILLDPLGRFGSVFGAYYGGPALDLLATRVPDTSRPVAIAAALSRSEAAPGDVPNGISVDVTIDDVTLAPVDGLTTIYNSLGHSVGGAQGGIRVEPDGRCRCR